MEIRPRLLEKWKILSISRSLSVNTGTNHFWLGANRLGANRLGVSHLGGNRLGVNWLGANWLGDLDQVVG